MIKYSPIKFRELNEYCTPQGPDINSAKPVEFSLAGSKIRFLAPKHKTQYSSAENVTPVGHYSIDNDSSRRFSHGVVDQDSWRFIPLCNRSWSFYGPWFVGAIAELNMSVSVIMPSEHDESTSFFNPRVFEFSISKYLEARYKSDISFGGAEWIAPVNWQPSQGLPATGVTFDVVPNAETDNSGKYMKYFLMPVGDSQILEFSFGLDQIMPGNLNDKDEMIDRSSMDALVKNIIASINIDLSKEAILQQDLALEGMQNKDLVSEFPPIKFTTDEQDAEWNEYLKLHGSKALA
ncbi:hypothetical protein R50073_16700 [Maricurvus nonylphenolicus]|uniref:hypothetical protein n=1 Tax=Maricurvus nonylphenolicus TaxID=1008307 RepID=UPI0036F35DC9